MVKMNSEGHRVPSESQSDVQVMRRWFKNNARKIDLRPRCHPLKTPVPVNVGDVNVKYGDGGKEKFMVRVYDPQDGSGSEGVLRPALIMYHGGGWVLGDATADEGKQISQTNASFVLSNSPAV
jgi:acetyl esterase/lipase